MHPGTRRLAGRSLRYIATALYLFFILGIIQLTAELAKGFEIDRYIRDYWISFGGAREVGLLTILFFIGARLADSYAKKLYPKLNRARGWGEFIE